jgi:hypothetical protein
MSRKNWGDEVNELRARMEKLQKEKEAKERESRLARFPELMALAIAAMKASKELTWNNKQGNTADTGKKTELIKKAAETSAAFIKGYREIVKNDLKWEWGAELQKSYVQSAPEALLIYYLSDSPNQTKPLAYSLKKAAEDYIYGWELLGKKERQKLPGPIDKVGNGALAVQILIEQLKEGDDIQKLQAQILEKVFHEPINHFGQKKSEPKNFTLGEALDAE